MGVRAVLGREPLELALRVTKDTGDALRRRKAQIRMDLYADNIEPVLLEEIQQKFREEAVRARLRPFLRTAACQSLFKRIVNEIARPVYAVPPVRRVSPDRDQRVFDEIAKQSRLNYKMDELCRLAHAGGTAWLQVRYVPRLGVVLDVVTSNIARVIPDPDDPLRELAIIYDKVVESETQTYIDDLGREHRKETVVHVYWDDAETFAFDNEGREIVGSRKPNTLGVIPFVPVHTVPRWGGRYWNETAGDDLVSGQLGVSLLTALTLKLHKSQGEKQIVVQGDIAGFPKDQILDSEGAIVAPEGTSVTTLDLATDSGHYLKSIEEIRSAVAANHGISRERLNQNSTSTVTDVGLNERRADAVKVMAEAEHAAFEIIRLVSQENEDGSKRLSDSAEYTVDFGDVSMRADPKGTLELWKEMRSMGLRNVLDDIKALNPEIRTDEDAWDELRDNMLAEAKYILERRALNIPDDASMEKPGQNPQDNGAMGPRVRDGEMTRDEAAEQAEVGEPDVDA